METEKVMKIKYLRFFYLKAINWIYFKFFQPLVEFQARLKNLINSVSGHPDCFAIAGPGTIWKKTTLDDGEIRVYEALQQLKNDTAYCIVPRFYR
jgi:hypothetical protein